MNNIERANTVLYELYSDKFGKLSIQEPSGWSEDVRSYNRDVDSRGIVSKIDIDLEFFGDGAKYLRDIYYTLGIQEKVLLIKYEKNRFTLSEEWEIKYIQELDLGTFKENQRTGNVTVNSTEGGLYSDIKNRESDEYDILNNFSADDIDIGQLETLPFEPLGRKIFIESLLRDEQTDFRINGTRSKQVGNTTRVNVRSIPLDIVYKSGDGIQPPVNSFITNNNREEHSKASNITSTQEIGDLFYLQANQDNVRLSIKLDLEFKVTNLSVGGRSTPVSLGVHLYHTTLVDAKDKNKEITEIITPFNPSENMNVLKKTDEGGYNTIVTLDKGDSLGIMFTSTYYYDGSLINFPRGWVDVYLNVLKSKLIIEDLTAYNEQVSVSKCIKPLTFFDRLVAKITGKTGLVKSSIFESGGEYEYMVLDNGLWARGFPDVYLDSNEEEKRIQITTSFKEAFQSFNYLEPLVWFTDFIGDKEYVRIEKATYTQQNFIGIKLGKVDDINYESSKIDYFSKITLGQEGDLEYEDLNGLDETNGKSSFSTFITKNDSEYSVISKYRFDSVGYELTRRLNFKSFPTEDSKRDNSLWVHDAKRLSSGVITHKKWNDDDRFDSLPKGVYHPESSWNLWLSPMNRLYYGHVYSINRGLYHYPNKKINFNSSNANQNLTTIKNNFELKESGSLTIKDTLNPRVEATKINLSFKMTQKLEKLFNGFTVVKNDKIPNYFGLIEYEEKGKKKYGRLVKLESSEKATLTLIKAKV